MRQSNRPAILAICVLFTVLAGGCSHKDSASTTTPTASAKAAASDPLQGVPPAQRGAVEEKMKASIAMNQQAAQERQASAQKH